MPILILMMGIPGSGKSTIANKLKGFNDAYISRDEVRFGMLKDGEPYFSKENQVMDAFVGLIDNALQMNKRFVFADATHLNRASRAKLLNRLKNKPEQIWVCYVKVPLHIALQRNSLRTGRSLVPEESIRQMHDAIGYPTKEEGIFGVFEVDENGMINIDNIKIFGKENKYEF